MKDRIIKFEYIYSDGKGYLKQIYTIEQLEVGQPVEFWDENPLIRDYKIVARRQFVGYNDKNGKPIFDGDILQLYMLHDRNPYHRIGSPALKTTVTWNDSRSNWGLSGKMAGLYEDFGELIDCLDGVEVIGNIYEKAIP